MGLQTSPVVLGRAGAPRAQLVRASPGRRKEILVPLLLTCFGRSFIPLNSAASASRGVAPPRSCGSGFVSLHPSANIPPPSLSASPVKIISPFK